MALVFQSYLLRFGVYSVYFWGSNTSSPGVWKPRENNMFDGIILLMGPWNPASVDMEKYPIIFWVSYIPGGARFQPSTVFHQPRVPWIVWGDFPKPQLHFGGVRSLFFWPDPSKPFPMATSWNWFIPLMTNPGTLWEKRFFCRNFSTNTFQNLILQVANTTDQVGEIKGILAAPPPKATPPRNKGFIRSY